MHTILVFFYLSHNFTHFFRTSVYLEHEGKGHSFVSSNVDVESWTGRTRYCLKDTCVKPHWIQQALKINWKKNHTSRWSKKNKTSLPWKLKESWPHATAVYTDGVLPSFPIDATRARCQGDQAAPLAFCSLRCSVASTLQPHRGTA